MRRREFLGLAGATLVAGVSTQSGAQAADWPERPVKLILPYAPGGATDLIGRPWADKLSQAFGQQFVIENRGGASGIIGTEAVAKVGAGRLHVSAHAQRPAHRAAEPAQDALRSGQELHARGPRRRSHQRLRHPSCRRPEDLQGDDRLRQGQSRQARLRLGWPRHVLAPAHRDAEGQRPASTSCTCPTAAAPTRSTICSPTTCR